MKNVLILGASGQIASWAIHMLACQTDVKMTLLVRNPSKLNGEEPVNSEIVIGDASDQAFMDQLMAGKDIVYANLAGEVDEQMKVIISAMKKNNVQRIVSINTLGIYNEVPGEFGEWNNQTIGEYFPPYRKCADILECSGLDYTIIRAAWLTDYDEVDYEVTQKDEPFKGTEVSRKSVATQVVKIINNPSEMVNKNIGLNKPDTDGPKPAFM
ncbi:SDR family oxidoreductase [Enterobacter sp. LM3]|uniref:SDR family oxidoreductase n=1 Tax=Enterobacter sp. LM3 TaxID=3384450 RepID=UPI0015DC12CB|nr:NAD-dependent dehydratase [Enterobacter cloacae]